MIETTGEVLGWLWIRKIGDSAAGLFDDRGDGEVKSTLCLPQLDRHKGKPEAAEAG